MHRGSKEIRRTNPNTGQVVVFSSRKEATSSPGLNEMSGGQISSACKSGKLYRGFLWESEEYDYSKPITDYWER